MILIPACLRGFLYGVDQKGIVHDAFRKKQHLSGLSVVAWQKTIFGSLSGLLSYIPSVDQVGSLRQA